jgi:acetyltransferase EpsM
VADLIHQGGQYEVSCFVEGINRDTYAKKVGGLLVISMDDVGLLDETHVAVCAVGSQERDAFIQRASPLGLRLTTFAHSRASVSLTASIGTGVIISPGVIVGGYATIAEHVIINRGALIGHPVKIGRCSTVSPGANLAGKCAVGSHCYGGMGAIIIDGISIGNSSVIGAGAVVTKDVPERVQVEGVPARIVKEL